MKNNDQEIIEKWLKAIHYTRAEDRAAYLMKAIIEKVAGFGGVFKGRKK